MGNFIMIVLWIIQVFMYRRFYQEDEKKSLVILKIVMIGLLFLYTTVQNLTTVFYLILFLAMILTVIEIFIPDFGVVGITAIIMYILAILITLGKMSFDSVIVIALYILTFIVEMVIYMFKFIDIHPFVKWVENKSVISTTISKNEIEDLTIGEQGITTTQLKNIGYAEIKGKEYEVESIEGFIEKGLKVEIVSIKGSKIKVKRIEQERNF